MTWMTAMGRRSARMRTGLVVAGGLAAACGAPADQAGQPDGSAAVAAVCVVRGEMPIPTPPFPDRAALCEAPHGDPPPPDLLPPVAEFPEAEPAYTLRLQRFIADREYLGLGWLYDLNWRLTGPYEGCQNDPNGENFGVHPAVRIYYSPELIDWLCGDRSTELPDGSMIVKEMHSIDSLAVDAEQLMWLPEQDYTTPTEWTVMVKSRAASVDGWFWTDYSPGAPAGNPPINGPSAITSATPITERDPAYYPTGNQFAAGKKSSNVFPYYGFGNYCVNCHASAVSESTYSTLDNILGPGIRYPWLGPDDDADPGEMGIHLRSAAPSADRVGSGFTPALPEADPAFLAQFPELPNRSFSELLATRFPAETYDHAVSQVHGAVQEMFITSDQCLGCHDATANRAGTPNMVLADGATQVNLSPWAEWRASPMGLGGRDPIFFAQLETETNLFANLGSAYQGDLREQIACIQNTCLHCHGVMGQRQLALDTAGGPERCRELVPTNQKTLFTRDLVYAWRDHDVQNAKYGGLARDGISCAVCHRISEEEIGEPATFTGNFHTGPAGELYGPFQDDVRPKPMEHALGITPTYGAQTTDSTLCASCHAILLPVFDSKTGKLVTARFEQTTYLEWLNSDFLDESCQDCHMPDTFHATPLAFEIANIEDSDYPETEGRLPDADIDLVTRSPYRRHLLYGLNLFLNEMFQQFPILLGLRQLDYMSPQPTPALQTARDAALEDARERTAEVSIGGVTVNGGTLVADVTVTSKTGHHLPSGVGFRRLFIELLVLDADRQPLFASGRTNALGLIENGLTGEPLESELLPGGGQPEGACELHLNYQVHHQVITSGDQVQIYEELVQNTEDVFTTSFLHRAASVKDNRVRPRGWKSTGPYADETEPEGPCTVLDPDYQSDGKPLPGKDTVRYELALGADAARAATVQATLYSQSIPPYYLKQRFASGAGGPRSQDAQRLYYLSSHLNVANARDGDGELFLSDWKLRVDGTSAPVP